MMEMKTSSLDLIGNTPLLKVRNMDTGLCELYLKLENQNPGGSIKDRIAIAMIEAAEKDGKIKRGDTLVEATAGNTGLGLAFVAAQKGYRLILVIPDKMSQEKILHLRAMGAKIIITRSDVEKGHPEYYQDLAQKICRETPNSYYINQFKNEANPIAHEMTTGPEIWEQMNHDVDAVVCGVGSGGTLSGLSRFFEKVSPKTELVLADPKGSILTDYIKTGTMGKAGSWLVEGIGEDFIPDICDLSRVKNAYLISDQESFLVAREVLLKEGILGGSSAGSLVAAALRYCRESKTKKRVVTFICDSGNKYLSKMFNDFWMGDHGFLETKDHGDLRDLVARPFSADHVVSVSADHTLLTAFNRMKMYEFSQLPVIENGKVVGILDETDILIAVTKDSQKFRDHVKNYMSTKLELLSTKTTQAELLKVFDRGMVGILYVDNTFYGLITKTDLLNYMRRKLS